MRLSFLAISTGVPHEESQVGLEVNLGARLDDGLQVGHAAQVGIGNVARPRALASGAQPQAVQLRQDLGLNLRVLRDEVSAGAGSGASDVGVLSPMQSSIHPQAWRSACQG